MTDYVLSESRSAMFDASGAATIRDVGPARHGEKWEITSTSVSTTSNDQTTLTIYRNAGLSQQVEGTVSGNLDTSDTKFSLNSGQKLYLQWVGGNPGTTAQATFEGTRTITGDRGGGI